jgi:hypothetical protein
MNWFKENPILTAILAILLAGAGAMTYFAIDAWAQYDAAVVNYNTQVKNVEAIKKKFYLLQIELNDPIKRKDFVNQIEEVTNQYKEALDAFRVSLSKMEVPLEPITPQEFQDNLRNAVNNIRAKAQEKKVKLPDKFYLGFEDFQSQLPTPEAAPILNREFKTIQKLVNQLVDLKVDSIDLLERKQPTPQAAPTPSPAQGKKPADLAPVSPKIGVSYLTLTFTSSLEKCRYAINEIPKSKEFLIVRNLTIENTKPAPPSRNPKPDQENLAQQSVVKDSPKTIQVIVGTESVKSSLNIEILDFPDLKPEGAAAK